ncbi:MAG: hypothetical protein C5S49_01295 [Candidatus Methanogaster sp.]|nr:MAG: hypothetical protein C5S49_01295 [ANME-2 cluster archaeon]
MTFVKGDNPETCWFEQASQTQSIMPASSTRLYRFAKGLLSSASSATCVVALPSITTFTSKPRSFRSRAFRRTWAKHIGSPLNAKSATFPASMTLTASRTHAVYLGNRNSDKVLRRRKPHPGKLFLCRIKRRSAICKCCGPLELMS